MMIFLVLYWCSLWMFILGLPALFFGALLSMAAEKVGQGIDWYFERRVARRGHRLPPA